jgi:UDP-2,3-diacylglucosamine hydrolase
MQEKFEILEGAFIVGDAHYSHNRPQFLEFLKAIATKELNPPQLILMGDIFDALFGDIPYTHKLNQEAIDLINEISLYIEVVYLEGNHDFNLKEIFAFVKVFPISMQPVLSKMDKRAIFLAHGDIESDLKYRVYTSLIRNSFVLLVLKIIDSLSRHTILKALDRYLSKKEDCREFLGLEAFILKRLGEKYKCDYFIEGHYHQNRVFRLRNFTYINLAAFACNQRYFIVKSKQDIEFLEEKIFSKGM